MFNFQQSQKTSAAVHLGAPLYFESRPVAMLADFPNEPSPNITDGRQALR